MGVSFRDHAGQRLGPQPSDAEHGLAHPYDVFDDNNEYDNIGDDDDGAVGTSSALGRVAVRSPNTIINTTLLRSSHLISLEDQQDELSLHAIRGRNVRERSRGTRELYVALGPHFSRSNVKCHFLSSSLPAACQAIANVTLTKLSHIKQHGSQRAAHTTPDNRS